MHKLFKKDIFISHSSINAPIAEQLGAFLKHLGISSDRIFCSSVLGQGVNNGEKLNDAVFSAIKDAKIIIYIVSRVYPRFCVNSKERKKKQNFYWAGEPHDGLPVLGA